MLREGDFIGPYQIVALIGHGGMATVYKAHHARLNRYVAIKVMHSDLASQANFQARFEREAQIIARLDHPNIVPVFDFDEHEGQPYLVIKYVQGRTLESMLKERVLTPEEIVRLMTPIADALTYAHDQGVLHRDIKPSNILIDEKGTPYLTDFGLARLAREGSSTMSQSAILGTPHYISPEQALGQGELDARADIYSLGVVLYQLVVGRVPFMGDTPFSIVHDHIYTPLPAPSTLNPQISPEVERVLFKALAKEPVARYDSAILMVEALRRAVEKPGAAPAPAAQRPASAPEETPTEGWESKATLPPLPSAPGVIPPGTHVPPGSQLVVHGAPDPGSKTSKKAEFEFDASQFGKIGSQLGEQISQFVSQIKEQVEEGKGRPPGPPVPPHAPGTPPGQEGIGYKLGAQVGQFVAQMKAEAEAEGFDWSEESFRKLGEKHSRRHKGRGRGGKSSEPLTEEERVRRFVEERSKKRQEVITTFIVSVFVVPMTFVIWLIGMNIFGGICAIPWFFLAWFGMAIAVVTEWFEYYSKYGGGADRVEQEVQRELARLGRSGAALDEEDTEVIVAKQKNEAEVVESLPPEDLEDRRVRLSDDGELSDSFIQNLQAEDRAKRKRGEM